ncbi:MAG TPA: MFS transporter [Pirellulaceae bacterium]|nr:MFS transporter [Pirellulaceae bacterium]
MSLAPPPRPANVRREAPPEILPPAPATSPVALLAEPRAPRVSPRGDMRASIGDAASYSVMVGIGETYFAAFALFLGTGETFAGIIATLPMLVGASLQLATPWALRRLRSYRAWVVLCASLQAAALFAMPTAALFMGTPAAALWVFVAAAAYWAASQATGPAWNTWIEEIIPRRVRANFFACRARTSQMCTLIGFVAGGIALQLGKAQGWLLAAFAGIFLIGSACRFLSAWFLSTQTEPSCGKYETRSVSLREAIFRTSGDVGVPLVLYLLAVQTAVQISGPYFTPFMLVKQELSYFSYMVLIGIGFLGKVIALPLWGRVAQKAGARRLLWIGGTSIVPVAGLWIFADLFDPWHSQLDLHLGLGVVSVPISGKLIYIGVVQLISGLAWAAYELAMLLMFFEAIPRQDRASVLTFYNFGNAAALVVGGLIGAAILQLGSESHLAYLVLFGCSSLARLCTVLLLRQAPEPQIEIVQPALRVISVHAEEGGVDRPILPSLDTTGD